MAHAMVSAQQLQMAGMTSVAAPFGTRPVPACTDSWPAVHALHGLQLQQQQQCGIHGCGGSCCLQWVVLGQMRGMLGSWNHLLLQRTVKQRAIIIYCESCLDRLL